MLQQDCSKTCVGIVVNDCELCGFRRAEALGKFDPVHTLLQRTIYGMEDVQTAGYTAAVGVGNAQGHKGK
jgi:hypothetical protein